MAIVKGLRQFNGIVLNLNILIYFRRIISRWDGCANVSGREMTKPESAGN